MSNNQVYESICIRHSLFKINPLTGFKYKKSHTERL